MTVEATPAENDSAVLDDVFSRDSTGDPAPVEDSARARDDKGRFAPKEAREEPKPAEQQAEADPEPQPSPEAVDPDTNRHVPLSELKSERAKRQEKERLLMEAEARAKAYEEQVRFFQQQQQRPQQPAAQPAPPPDPLTDPEGYFSYVQQQLINQRLDTSEMLARRHYGSQVVDEAFQAANQAGVIRSFLNNPDPYGALVDWHRKQKVLAEVGDDPDVYRKRLEEEIRQKVLEELKAGRPQQQQQRFPGTLADTTSAGAATAPVAQSDGAILNDIFDSNRKRR